MLKTCVSRESEFGKWTQCQLLLSRMNCKKSNMVLNDVIDFQVTSFPGTRGLQSNGHSLEEREERRQRLWWGCRKIFSSVIWTNIKMKGAALACLCGRFSISYSHYSSILNSHFSQTASTFWRPNGVNGLIFAKLSAFYIALAFLLVLKWLFISTVNVYTFPELPGAWLSQQKQSAEGGRHATLSGKVSQLSFVHAEGDGRFGEVGYGGWRNWREHHRSDKGLECKKKARWKPRKTIRGLIEVVD